MPAIVLYLLKVVICSGVLYAYYLLALRNKIFHRWNRFYLLASIIISLALPVLQIQILRPATEQKATVVQLLETITTGDEIIIEYGNQTLLKTISQHVALSIYIAVCFVLIAVFLVSLHRIFKLRKNSREKILDGIHFISTEARGTPFSFFNYIFWNNKIPLQSDQGQRILNHELVHVREHHSLDKLFVSVTLFFFWINPFFWLMRKELFMIHEFLADKKALESGDVRHFAEMILQSVYPSQKLSLTNNLFHSPIKRRLAMITKNKNPRISYFSRLLVLPLAGILLFAFSLKMQKEFRSSYEGQKINVIIDPGHGGNDAGAQSRNVLEKDLVLSIAQKVKALNNNPDINIILTRESDKTVGARERPEIAKSGKGDLFISLHVDANPVKNNVNGVKVYIPKNDNHYLAQSKILGSAMVKAFQGMSGLSIDNQLIQQEMGIWVLKANSYPAILIEAGYISNDKDFDFITQDANQDEIAKRMLKGINDFASVYFTGEQFKLATFPINDTTPAGAINSSDIRSIEIENDKAKITYDNGTTEIIDRDELKRRNLFVPPPPPPVPPSVSKTTLPEAPAPPERPEPVLAPATPQTPPPPPSPLPDDAVYLLKGKRVDRDVVAAIAPNNIKGVLVTTGDAALKKYGFTAPKGVVEVVLAGETLPNDALSPETVSVKAESIDLFQPKIADGSEFFSPKNVKDTIPDKIFTKVENEAEFPGGHDAWIKYMMAKIQDNNRLFTEKDFGTCLLKFLVDKDGRVSQVEATTLKDTHLAQIAVRAIEEGPKWIPARQNDVAVASYRLQPVTLTKPK